jgi:hypothetical protein
MLNSIYTPTKILIYILDSFLYVKNLCGGYGSKGKEKEVKKGKVSHFV